MKDLRFSWQVTVKLPQRNRGGVKLQPVCTSALVTVGWSKPHSGWCAEQKISCPTRVQTFSHPVCTESQYQLHYPGPSPHGSDYGNYRVLKFQPPQPCNYVRRLWRNLQPHSWGRWYFYPQLRTKIIHSGLVQYTWMQAGIWSMLGTDTYRKGQKGTVTSLVN